MRRLRPGEVVVACDGQGGWRPCEVVRNSAAISLAPTGDTSHEDAAQPEITVGLSLVKGDRTEWAVEKLAELGVDRIVPLICDRTIARRDETRNARKGARLQRIAREASMQARRLWLPVVTEPVTFREMLESRRATAAGEVAIAHPGGQAIPPSATTVLVGPEGGWSTAELDLSRARDVPRVGLARDVLRVETAAVAAGALLSALRSGLAAPLS